MLKTVKVALALAIAMSLTAAASISLAAQAQDKTKQAEQTWTGNISDSMCGKSHGDRGGTMQKDHDCAVKCAKNGSYVFVVGDKIFKIADQKLPALETHAGHRVEITGTMKDDTITVSKVTMLPVK